MNIKRQDVAVKGDLANALQLDIINKKVVKYLFDHFQASSIL